MVQTTLSWQLETKRHRIRFWSFHLGDLGIIIMEVLAISRVSKSQTNQKIKGSKVRSKWRICGLWRVMATRRYMCLMIVEIKRCSLRRFRRSLRSHPEQIYQDCQLQFLSSNSSLRWINLVLKWEVQVIWGIFRGRPETSQKKETCTSWSRILEMCVDSSRGTRRWRKGSGLAVFKLHA